MRKHIQESEKEAYAVRSLQMQIESCTTIDKFHHLPQHSYAMPFKHSNLHGLVSLKI